MWDAIVDRQQGFLNFTPELARVMRSMRLAVIGAGGNGVVMDHLVRLGFENFTLVDPDVVEPSNLNRLPFTTAQIGQAKVQAWRDYLTAVNPGCTVSVHQMAVKRTHGPWLSEHLADVDLVFLGTTDIEANITTGRVCALLGKRMIVGPASSGAWVVSTFTHQDGMTLERVAGLDTEAMDLTDIDYAAAEAKVRAVAYYPGRASKYEQGVREAVLSGAVEARSCKTFVSLTNAAMAFEAVKNTAEMNGLALRGTKITAMPVLQVFDPYSGCAYYYDILKREIGIPNWLTGEISWSTFAEGA
jgi:molybdopterin/thiamine biosynthesis adenylyltransferase